MSLIQPESYWQPWVVSKWSQNATERWKLYINI